MPAAPPEERGERPRAGNPPWRRRLILAVAVAAVFAAAALVLDRLRPDQDSPRPIFGVSVALRGAGGRFDAVTTNVGDRSRRPTCTVSAFDIYGNPIGSEVFELDGLSAGEGVDWNGRLEVTRRVERMTIECR